MTSSEIRGSFLEFFRKNGHAVLPTSSLVPGNDPTLLFTNAGMVQFKDLFLGKEVRDYSRAATAQRCVRAGGKHNDLENVGYTARHHTFFEMMGNFSFGDYFKREAIHFAWNFISGTLGIPKDRLWVTVFTEDDEAERIWTEEIGIDPTRCTRMGEKSNFWSMGETGPCGPCTEIFYDHGAEIPGGPPGSADEDGDRYVEIWNLVFMQYDRASDGVLVPLPKPSVDTGMGLERVAAVMQGVHSNYDIDMFRSLIRSAAEVTATSDLESSSLRVIADHIRACTFLIVDGVVPSNEGRGFVLRRIIRRAIRHGYKLGQTHPFFHKLVPSLVREMGAYYTELVRGEARATQVLAQEENRFAETLTTGMALLDAATAKLTSTVIPGETVFRLHDTYGFPLDLTADVARERGLTIDQAGFDAAMEAQRIRASAASKFGSELPDSVKLSGKTDR
jgi:alanyl-tRNA synthetase